MCGIAGIISPHQSDINIQKLKIMSDTLAHRGPDGEGVWISPKTSAGLAHRRLAIIDLSKNADQPMHYLDRYSIVFNGEIYNYPELRSELQKAGYYFSSNSDTEVILAAFDCYKEKCLHYFDGMFSFAIWDEVEQTLFAARDRFGEKPFYYFKEKERFIFASEMKAIWATGVEKRIENKMLLNYLALGYVQHASDKSQTFYSEIYSLPPAHYLYLYRGNLKINQYWTLDKQAEIRISEKEAIEKIDYLLSTSVARRMRSDVTVGSSLSGGIDSSSLLYYITQQQKSVKTFSAVFPGFKKDETDFINKAADSFKINNYKVTPSETELITDFEKLLYHQEEPFTSSSIYAQYRVFQLAKENNIKVLLEGQGADEIFGGYPKYIHWYLQEMVNRYRFSQCGVERNLFKKNNINVKWGIKNIIAAFLPSHVAIALEKKAYNQIVHHPDLSRHMLAHVKGREWEGIHKPIITKLNDILYFDVMEKGLEELLRFADRNSMAHGCEARMPYLNHELVSFVFSIPSRYKLNNGFTKSVLRKMMNDRLPKEIVWRTDKVAYEPPQKKWMESSMMKDYLHEAKRKLVYHDILKPEALQRKHKALDAHDAHNYDWRYLCVAGMI
ncbi:MAG: asparagine synthase (glutamine-hydrolyzing) [Bacteroidota bacterium]